MLEQNHVKKASEIAITAMAFSAAKLALWCLHDISTSKFKISFDRKNCVIYNTYNFFDFKRYTRNPSVNMYLLMYVEETQFLFLRCILYGIEFSKPLFRQCHMYMRLFFFKTCPWSEFFF